MGSSEIFDLPHVLGTDDFCYGKWFVEFVRLCLFDDLEPQQVTHLIRGVEMVAIKQDPV